MRLFVPAPSPFALRYYRASCWRAEESTQLRLLGAVVFSFVFFPPFFFSDWLGDSLFLFSRAIDRSRSSRSLRT